MGEAVKYVRTGNGKVIHLATCRVLTRTRKFSEWEWAQNKTWDQIWQARSMFGYHLCRVCNPQEATVI